jgi:hypothetical protein
MDVQRRAEPRGARFSVMTAAPDVSSEPALIVTSVPKNQ